MMYIVTCRELSRIKTSRSAVVPYVFDESTGELYFLFGIDAKTHDITDLGGGVKRYEYALNAGLREFREETKDVFGKYFTNSNNFSSCYALIDKRMCSLFIPVSKDWLLLAPILFSSKNIDPSKKNHNEISHLIWLKESELLQLLSSPKTKMWTLLSNFYRKTFTSEFRDLLVNSYIDITL